MFGYQNLTGLCSNLRSYPRRFFYVSLWAIRDFVAKNSRNAAPRSLYLDRGSSFERQRKGMTGRSILNSQKLQSSFFPSIAIQFHVCLLCTWQLILLLFTWDLISYLLDHSFMEKLFKFEDVLVFHDCSMNPRKKLRNIWI